MRNPIRAPGGGNRRGAPLTAFLLTLLAVSPGASGAAATLAADDDHDASVDPTRSHARARLGLDDEAALGASPRVMRSAQADAPAPVDAELRTRGARADAGLARLALGDDGRISTRDGAWTSFDLAVDAPPTCATPVAACAPSLTLALGADNADVLDARDATATLSATRAAAAAPARATPATQAALPLRAHGPVAIAHDAEPATPAPAEERARKEPSGEAVTYAGTSTPTPLAPAPILLLAAATLAIGLAALLLAPVALYHRIRSRDVLANGTRGRVHAHVRGHPGASASDVARALALDPTTARYHLRRLQKEGLATAEGAARRERWFAAGTLASSDRRALLVPDGARRVLDAIAGRPHATKSDLARALAIARTTVTWHVERLEKAGLVECERAGREVRVRVRAANDADAR